MSRESVFREGGCSEREREREREEREREVVPRYEEDDEV